MKDQAIGIPMRVYYLSTHTKPYAVVSEKSPYKYYELPGCHCAIQNAGPAQTSRTPGSFSVLVILCKISSVTGEGR